MHCIDKGQQEHETQKQHLVDLWVQFSHTMDTLPFYLYLLLMASTIIKVIVPWNTSADTHPQTPVWSFSLLWKPVRLSCPFKSQPPSLGSHLVFNPLCRPD